MQFLQTYSNICLRSWENKFVKGQMGDVGSTYILFLNPWPLGDLFVIISAVHI